jgi:hypothetical protein
VRGTAGFHRNDNHPPDSPMNLARVSLTAGANLGAEAVAHGAFGAHA